MNFANTLIGIATFRRPDGLSRLLQSLHEDESARPSAIVVVDNDPAKSGEHVVDNFQHLDITYVPEPTPGIAAVRNRALDHAVKGGFDALVFVDDDEYVANGWLDRLKRTAVEWNADIVCGPVVPVIPDEAPAWIRRGGFFDRPQAPTGSTVRWPATNNALVRMSSPGLAAGTRFSEDFSLTGGSDTDFFYRLREAGARFAWSNEAIVQETVPLGRANFRWLWRRGLRLGNVSARMLARRHSAPYVAAVAVSRILAATPLTVLSLLTGRRSVGNSAMHLPKGVGMIQALRGDLTIEYQRTTPPPK